MLQEIQKVQGCQLDKEGQIDSSPYYVKLSNLTFFGVAFPGQDKKPN